MGTITALEPQARHPDRYNLSLDGRFACGLDGALVVAEGLHIGQELDAAALARLQALSDERRLFDAALRFLGPRPRSRAEVRRRLVMPRRDQPSPPAEVVDRVLNRLQELDMLDDRAFADFWVENRERFSPRSARALSQELRQHGVDRDTVEAVSAPARDDERALAAGRPRLRSLANADYVTFRTRLGQFLLRRGFSYGVAQTAVRALWEEAHDDDAAPDDGDESTAGVLDTDGM